MKEYKHSFNFDLYNSEDIQTIFGVNDKNLKIIEEILDIEVSYHKEQIILKGNERDILIKVELMFMQFAEIVSKSHELGTRDVIYLSESIKNDLEVNFNEINNFVIAKNSKKQSIKPKTKGQLSYIKSIINNDLVFGVGPAGSGKTYLAVVYGVKMLRDNMVKKIILTRPAVEAGESLGFLPGDMKEKVDPYLRPLYDALYDMLGEDATNRLIERQTIEIAPLAYMRGRTLENAYVILDEAQNTTIQQMKMFLTRLGFNSKMVITGDISQIDLPKGKESGLKNAVKVLDNINGISINYLSELDVVRNPLVKKVIKAYDKYES